MEPHRHSGGRSRKLALGVALLAAVATGLPWMWGDGVDVPDDALFYHVASWEWLHWAWTHDTSPWFVHAKLGGVSLFGDAVPMGPFYPAAWLLRVLPASTALPVAGMVHVVGSLLAVRWLARTLGASPLAATLAGAAVAVGPIGTMGFVDCRSDAWAMVVWFPVALAAMEKLRQAPDRRRRMGWLALAATALALVLLGAHVRLAVAAMAVFSFWGLLSGLPLSWPVAAAALAVVAGSPGWLPVVVEWGQASADASPGERMGVLAAHAESGLTWDGVPGLLSPRPWASYTDYSIGVVLGVLFVLALGRDTLRLSLRRSAPVPGRMALLAILVMGASLSPEVPGLRYLFAPLLIFSHPVNDVYTALATIVAAAAGASAFDALLALDRQELRRRLLGPRGFVLAALLLSGAALAILGSFRDDASRLLYVIGLVQATAGVALAAAVLVRPAPRRRAILLVALGLLDLGLFAVRMHTAVPSGSLGLAHRTDVEGVEQLAGGYLDVDDLSRLESFAYAEQEEPEEGGVGFDPPLEEFWEDTAEAIQTQIVERRWPAHLGMAHGYRGLSGRAKLPPARQLAVLAPLAETLKTQPGQRESSEVLFAADGLGARTLRLHGIEVAAGTDGSVHVVGAGVPQCRIPLRLELVEPTSALVDRLLDGGFESGGEVALVEDGAHAGPVGRADGLDCSSPGRIEVGDHDGTVVVLRQRLHPGWQVRVDGGVSIEPFAVDQVHMGLAVPAGARVLSYRFAPPGLAPSAWASGASWLAIGVLGFVGLRRKE